MWFLAGFVLLCLLILPLLAEWRGHARNLASLQLRVHVHGTRGKTSLTRELARRLRARGLRTLARTTGDEAEWILPDGHTEPWKRKGQGRVLEYIAIARRAKALRCDALVVECMALQPETIHIASRLLDAHAIVITNTRPDHQEVMGLRSEDVAATLVNLLPPENTSAHDRTVPLVVVQQDAGAQVLVAAAVRRGHRVVEIPENTTRPWERASLLASCTERELYAEGILHAPQDCALQSSPVIKAVPEYPLYFLDLFSVNDVQSATEVLYDIARQAEPDLRCLPWVALLATRQDRPLRTQAFVSMIATESLLPHALPTGTHFPYTWLCLPAAKRLSWWLCVRAAWHGPGRTFAALHRAIGPCVVVGLGNVHGQGERYRRFFQAREK